MIRIKMMFGAVLGLVLSATTVTNAQFPGGGSMDPNRIFDMVARGSDVIEVDKLDTFSKGMFDRFASRFGLTGNVITRDQFTGAMNKLQDDLKSGRIDVNTLRNEMRGGMPSMGGAPAGGGGSGMSDEQIEGFFRRRDRNEDGLLQIDEMADSLRDELDRWDENDDQMIDMREYRAYVVARFGGGESGSSDRTSESSRDSRSSTSKPREPEKRMTIIRADSLPKEIPDWFASADAKGIKDGQVAMYEWKQAGKQFDEFFTYDLNNDGFITAEEYLRYKNGGKLLASAGTTNGAPSTFGAPTSGDRRDRGDRGSRGGDRGSDRGSESSRGGPPSMGGPPGSGGPPSGGFGSRFGGGAPTMGGAPGTGGPPSGGFGSRFGGGPPSSGGAPGSGGPPSGGFGSRFGGGAPAMGGAPGTGGPPSGGFGGRGGFGRGGSSEGGGPPSGGGFGRRRPGG
ncbi:MAG: hypothetical protein R3B84_11700 [Zavarzinella sp.]